jgi:two-component system sensor histidine kinase/response regulator
MAFQGGCMMLSPSEIPNKITLHVVFVVLITLLLGISSTYNWQGNAQLHTLMELSATLLAGVCGVVSLIRYYGKKDSLFLIIGVGFMGTALLDGFHGLVTSELFNVYMPSTLPSLRPWSWTASRQFLAFMLFFSWLFEWYKQRHDDLDSLSEITVYLSTAIYALASFLFFSLVSLPKAYYPEYLFHRPQEFIVAVFFLLALVGYLYKGRWRHDSFEYWLVLSLMAGLASQLLFMPLSASQFDINFDLAHGLKLLSYMSVLIGLFFNMHQMFQLIGEGKQRLQAILSTAVDGIVSINAKGVIESFNPGAEKIFGYCPEDVIGKNINMLMPEPYHSAHDGYLKNFCDTGIAKIIGTGREVEGLRKDGSTFPMGLSVGEMLVAGKQMFTGIVRDINARKNNDQIVKRYADRLALATQCGGIGVWEYDVNKSSLTWDEQMFRLYNVRQEDFSGAYEAWSSAIHPEDSIEAQKQLNDAIARSRDFNTEFRITWPDGSVRHIKAIATMSKSADGRGECMIGVNWDVTEHKNLMLELKQSRHDADAANKAKSAFLATMSHEIRTPMNGVLGMAEVLAHSALTEPQTELAQIILQSSTTLLSLIDDILDFSKIEAGRMDINSELYCIEELVESLCSTLSTISDKKNVKIHLFVSPKIPQNMFFDSTRLRQILYNLIGNAVKFCSDRQDRQGQVLVRLERVNKAPLRLAFSVTDNGIGMTEETLKNLYTPFTQAEVSTTRRFGGTGLGLVICKRLVELMLGELSVQSTLGLGSTFTVTMPFEAPAATEQNLADVHGLNCILVTSADYILDDLRAYLDFAGVQTHVVADAKDANKAAIKLAESVDDLVIVIHGNEYTTSSISKAFDDEPRVRRLLVTGSTSPIVNSSISDYVCIRCNPLRRKSLLQAVAVAAGRMSPHHEDDNVENMPLQRIAAPLSPKEAQAQGRLILVAEDDDINRKVIRQQFELLGYTGKIVNDGEQALRHWRTGRYGLLLTDLHMPIMDGYELTKFIREEEDMYERMPILALTANALRGEANNAKSAGVDEYLTKPIQLEALDAALRRWLPQSKPYHSIESSSNAWGEDDKGDDVITIGKDSQQYAVLDLQVLKRLVGNDNDTIAGFLKDYLVSALDLSERIFDAHEVGDYSDIAAIAHRLKSSSRSVGAMLLGELCDELEIAGKKMNPAVQEQVLATFSQTLLAVRQAIENELELNNKKETLNEVINN